jgi:hypothetical protein
MKDKELQDLIDQSLNETISEVDMKALEERMLLEPQCPYSLPKLCWLACFFKASIFKSAGG